MYLSYLEDQRDTKIYNKEMKKIVHFTIHYIVHTLMS